MEWNSDQEMVVLEVVEEGAKSGKDSEPSTLQELMDQFAEEGLEYTLNNHECTPKGAPAKANGDDEAEPSDGYVIQPKKTKVYFQYSPAAGNLKWSNVASLFAVDATWMNVHQENSVYSIPLSCFLFVCFFHLYSMAIYGSGRGQLC